MIAFTSSAWKDYLYWQQVDKKILKRINELVKDIERTPFQGLGKPEPLKHNLAGCFSRRIDAEHRLVYQFENKTVTIISCRYHY